MQKCEGCGKEIRYIASSRNVTYVCEYQETEIITFFGRMVKGHKLHECTKEIENGHKTDSGTKKTT